MDYEFTLPSVQGTVWQTTWDDGFTQDLTEDCLSCFENGCDNKPEPGTTEEPATTNEQTTEEQTTEEQTTEEQTTEEQTTEEQTTEEQTTEDPNE